LAYNLAVFDGWAQVVDGWALRGDGWANARPGRPLAMPVILGTESHFILLVFCTLYFFTSYSTCG